MTEGAGAPWGSPPASAAGATSRSGSGRSARQRVRFLALRMAGRLYDRTSGMPPPRSVLLIRPDHLGDMLFLTPGLRALREHLAETRITVLAGSWSARVLESNPAVDTVLTCTFPGFERQPKRSFSAPYRTLLQQAQQLRAQRFDAAVVLRFDHWWGAWLAAAASIPRRIGYDWPETQPFLTETLPYHSGRHEVEQNGALLAHLAQAPEWPLGPTSFAVTAEDRKWAEDWLAGRGVEFSIPLVAIHPGAGAAVKQWPIDRWADSAGRLIAATGARLVLTGSSAERPLTQALSAALAQPVLDAAGETSLGQLAALQERCALVLGSDCGPLHLAVAMRVPTVHLYGPVSPAKFGPWGDSDRHIVLTSGWSCAPCNRLDWRTETLGQHQCMAAITPDQVLRAALSLVEGRRSA